ncbi:MAG TPA: hypothetical protein VKZ68_05990 [Ohtaekwangia sp.]|nr:hypothetical protein [Ohtaekwangia sp.]
MKNREREKPRSDRPSGRQAPDDHRKQNSGVEAESLHQGQGPDFPTQERNMQEKNPAIETQRTGHPSKRVARPQTPPETISKKEKDE